MTRTRNNAQLWDALSVVGILRKKVTTPADTTLSADTAALAATYPVVAATNIAATDLLRVGAGSEAELTQVSSLASLVVTPVHRLEFAHDSGEVVVEMEKTDLGPTSDEGVSTEGEGDFSPIMAGTRRMVMGYQGGHYSPTVSFGLLEYALENLAVAHGMLESRKHGSGTAAVPERLVMNPAVFGADVDAMFYFTGLLHDTLTNVEVRLWGCEVDWTGAFRKQYRRTGGELVIPITVRVTSAIEVLTWK